jgi:formylglycine-generating enzyme required for sulfatase activity
MLDEVAWNGGNSNDCLHPVAQKKPNELGIYDMSGNANEICLDTYQENYCGLPCIDPLFTDTDKSYVVVRGGSHFLLDGAAKCSLAARVKENDTSQLTFIGFRIVLGADLIGAIGCGSEQHASFADGHSFSNNSSNSCANDDDDDFEIVMDDD